MMNENFILSTNTKEWTINTAARSIINNEQVVNLPPKPMALLAFLARHQGEVVSYEEIIKGVWDGRVSSNQSIINAVKSIRDALGVSKNDTSFLVTITKKGYHLTAGVAWHGGKTPASALIANEATQALMKRRQFRFGFPSRKMALKRVSLLLIIMSLYQVMLTDTVHIPYSDIHASSNEDSIKDKKNITRRVEEQL